MFPPPTADVSHRHNYTWDGTTLVRDYYGDTTVDFTYDASGRPYAMYYKSTPYFYILNLQGDVIRVVDGNGNTVASYEYDPYGKVISATGWLADINPIRYRGYYYDLETQLYHLWSRYYDPQTGRFINADALASTGQGALGYNMFAYCRNNPVTRRDTSGTDDVCATDFNQDNNPLNDLGSPSGGGGGGIWKSFTRTLKYAADGLKMASGQRNLTHKEKHHIISNKNSTKTIGCKEIADRYNYSLDHPSNIVPLEGHRGRHTNAYHDFVTIAITKLDVLADGSTDAFVEGMKVLGKFIQDNLWLPYAQYK